MHLKRLFVHAAVTVTSTVALLVPPSLLVEDTPTFVRPYVLPHHVGHLVATGDAAHRFPITSASSGGALTLLSTNAARSAFLSVPPHSHKRGYENFFCSKGALQLWLATSNDSQQVRLLEPGDLGASPPGRIHAFQTMRPDTELFGVTFPGGLEHMFYAGGGNTTFQTSSPYDALAGWGSAPRTNPPPSGAPTGPPRTQEQFDIYPVPGFVARTDIGNGSAPVSADWHVRPEVLPKDPSAPFYLAKDFAPKYLNSENGYTIVSPLNTLPRSAPYNFTLSYLTFSKPKAIAAVPWRTFSEHGAFRVQDGALSLLVEGYGDAVQLLSGDVAFLPQNTKYKVHAVVPSTKTLYVSVGGNGLAEALLKTAKAWEHASWPVNFP